MSNMKSRQSRPDASGAVSALALAFVAIFLLFIGTGVFAAWAFIEQQDYKNNVDEKIAVAVEAAKEEEAIAKEAEFAEREKSPLKTYNGPETYGSIAVQYPKTWSGYVVEGARSNAHVDAYFSPGTVPNVSDQKSVYALRIQVTNKSYSSELEDYQDKAESGALTVQPYALPKLPEIVGSRIEGQITNTKTGVVILLPLRDKTLKIYTEAQQYKHDLDTIILPNFIFAP